MEKIWIKTYPAGIPAEISIDHVASLVSLFEDACAKYADQVAYISMDREMTYGELDRDSDALAAWQEGREAEGSPSPYQDRELQRAAKDYPFLASLPTRSRGASPLEGLAQAAEGVDALVVQDACISVLANMAGLLAEFIGDELTMHMLQEIWPNAAERGGE